MSGVLAVLSSRDLNSKSHPIKWRQLSSSKFKFIGSTNKMTTNYHNYRIIIWGFVLNPIGIFVLSSFKSDEQLIPKTFAISMISNFKWNVVVNHWETKTRFVVEPFCLPNSNGYFTITSYIKPSLMEINLFLGLWISVWMSWLLELKDR